MRALIIISVIIAVFVLILFIPIRFRVFFSYKDDGVSSDMSLSYGFIRIKLPPEKKDKRADGKDKKRAEGESKEKTSYLKVLPKFIKQNLKGIKDLIAVVLKRLLSKTLKVDKLYINMVLGFDDAMNTGLIYGAVSGVIYNAAGLMDRKMRLEKHDIEIKPDFNDPHIFAETEAIISTNIFNVILLAVVALKRALPLYKNLKNMIGENNDGKFD